MALDPLTAGINLASGVIDRLFPNKTEAAKVKLKLFELEQTGELKKLEAYTDLEKAQIRLNEAEAASDKLWKSGWRPLFGWSCGAGFAYTYVIQPLLVFVMTMAGLGDRVAELPALDTAAMMPLAMGLLGLGWLRTKEKITGITSRNP